MIAFEVYIFIYLGIMFFSLVSFFFLEEKLEVKNAENNLPEIAILIAARNEESNIGSCIESIKKLVYPKDKLHIYIGNDQSTDNTLEVALKAIDNDSRFHIYTIEENIGLAKGKANVLAQLARKSTSEYIFITDADILVNPQWVKTLLQYFDDKTDLVSGSTLINDGSWQDLDWRYFTMVLQAMANCGIGCTAVGNNMAIRRSTYEKLGGYENIPFSIVEDYALFQQVKNNGFGWKNIYVKDCLNYTYGTDSLKQLVNQRKRWAKGGLEGFNWFWRALFGVFGIYHLVSLALLFINPMLALGFFSTKYILQLFINLLLNFKLNLKLNYIYLLTYEFYNLFFNTLLSIAVLTPGVVWKNRKY
ncbi:MAG: glycosyltransferase [Bacteroidetes bacterium]|nr:glycosyltransferase [Bacteroidota bacterium]